MSKDDSKRKKKAEFSRSAYDMAGTFWTQLHWLRFGILSSAAFIQIALFTFYAQLLGIPMVSGNTYTILAYEALWLIPMVGMMFTGGMLNASLSVECEYRRTVMRGRKIENENNYCGSFCDVNLESWTHRLTVAGLWILYLFVFAVWLRLFMRGLRLHLGWGVL